MAAESAFVDWLVDRLFRAGTRRLFGVPGGGTSLDLIAAAQRRGMEMVLTGREDAAVIMAGVSGVLTGAPGIAFTTKGPGLASAANGLASASLDRMPVLLISETFVPDELDYVSHQVFDQTALVAPLLQGGGGDILEASVAAVETWLDRGPQPMRTPAVMFPTGDALRRPVQGLKTSPTGPRQSGLDGGAVERARRMLSDSKTPVVVIGLEAARPDLEAPVRALAGALNAPALTTYMACGMVAHDHPSNAGIFTGGAIEQACVGEADLIVLVGLDPVELIRKPWPYTAPVIDLCEVARRPHYLEPALRLEAPLADSLAALLDDGAGTMSASTWTATRIAAHRGRFLADLVVAAEDGLSSSDVVAAAAEAFRGGPRLCIDAGAHMFSASTYWPAARARDVLISNGLASMGFAIPAGVAASLHDPARGAVAMTGDGGALMCMGELKTAAVTGANLSVVIFNDGRLSLIDIKREERQMPDLGLAWERPDFAAIARGFGCAAWRARTAEELEEACRRAAAHDGPCLIDACIESTGYLTQMKALRG